jgi:hypothetical protein
MMIIGLPLTLTRAASAFGAGRVKNPAMSLLSFKNENALIFVKHWTYWHAGQE